MNSCFTTVIHDRADMACLGRRTINHHMAYSDKQILRPENQISDLRSHWGSFVLFGINQQEAPGPQEKHKSLMLIVIFRCEISQVTSVPKFWWPRVSMRPQLCVYRRGDGTRLHSFEMWQGERNDEIISDLRVTVAFRGKQLCCLTAGSTQVRKVNATILSCKQDKYW